MNFKLEKKSVGYSLTLLDNGDTYINLELFNGWFCYRDEEAFEKQFGVCYVPEYALNEFKGKTITINDDVFYRLIDIEDAYTYQALLNVAHNDHANCSMLFEMCEGAYPETMYQELDNIFQLEEEME
jgi:hypothetical protein